MRDFTKKEQQALNTLEKAIEQCASLGLSFCIMSSALICVHQSTRIRAEIEAKKDKQNSGGSYPALAYAFLKEMPGRRRIEAGNCFCSTDKW